MLVVWVYAKGERFPSVDLDLGSDELRAVPRRGDYTAKGA